MKWCELSMVQTINIIAAVVVFDQSDGYLGAVPASLPKVTAHQHVQQVVALGVDLPEVDLAPLRPQEDKRDQLEVVILQGQVQAWAIFCRGHCQVKVVCCERR